MATRNIYVETEKDIPSRVTVHVITNGDDDGVLFVPESVCENKKDEWNEKFGIDAYSFVCGKCGYAETKKDVNNTLCLSIFDVKFCRNCGARVEN